MIAPHYQLALYVAGETDRSQSLIGAIEQLLGDRLQLTYELRVVDVLSDPATADADGVIMTPTLVIKLPEPEKRLFGDALDTEKLMLVLQTDRGAGGAD